MMVLIIYFSVFYLVLVWIEKILKKIIFLLGHKNDWHTSTEGAGLVD